MRITRQLVSACMQKQVLLYYLAYINNCRTSSTDVANKVS